MKYPNLLSMHLLCFLFVSTLTCYTKASSVGEYQHLVDKWLSLEAQNRELHNNWQQHKPQLLQRKRLLEKEKNQLEEKLKQNEQSQDHVSKKREQKLTRQADLEQQQRQLTLWLKQRLSNIREELNQLPPPLNNSWKIELENLSPESNNSEKLELVLKLLSKKSEFNHRISSVKTKIRIADGSERLVDQLYLGTAVGYYATPDGKHVGIGHPSLDGWQWQISEEMSDSTFKQALAMLHKQQAAELINVPVALRDKLTAAISKNESANHLKGAN